MRATEAVCLVAVCIALASVLGAVLALQGASDEEVGHES